MRLLGDLSDMRLKSTREDVAEYVIDNRYCRLDPIYHLCRI